MAATATNRSPSAIDALGEAITHMRQNLFPFRFGGWVTLGFVSLLESCGGNTASGAVRNRTRGTGDFDNPAIVLERAFAWIAAHMFLLVGGLMVIMVLSLLVMWLRSRAIFVYIDNVSTGRFDLVRPWGEHGGHADSYFGLSLIVQGASFILSLLVFAVGVLFIVWARSRDMAMIGIVMGAAPLLLLFLLSLVFAGVVDMALRDFVAPIQYSRGIGARDAGAAFLSMFGERFGLFIGYAILKFVVGIAVGIVVFITMCLTCCIGALPLINQTIFQPVFYADRAWSLKLLAQLGEDVFPKPAPPAPEGGLSASTVDAISDLLDENPKE